MDNEPTEPRYIVLRLRDGAIKRISELHAFHDALQYPIVFPYGTTLLVYPCVTQSTILQQHASQAQWKRNEPQWSISCLVAPGRGESISFASDEVTFNSCDYVCTNDFVFDLQLLMKTNTDTVYTVDNYLVRSVFYVSMSHSW